MRTLRCFQCNSANHLRPSYPELRKGNTHPINNIGLESDRLLKALINRREFVIVKDSGSSSDLIPRKFIRDI